MCNSIEIFSGAGGLAKGLELAGMKHLAFVEWNKDACKTLRMNYPVEIVHEADIRLFPFENYADIDVLAGGPPCQPFSLGGKAKGHMDERDMFPYAIDAIRKLRPKAFIFENVKGLLRESFSDYFRYIILQLQHPTIENTFDSWEKHLDTLEKADNRKGGTLEYSVSYKLLNAADYGVPQKRERVIIVGFRSDLDIDWSFPAPTNSEDSLAWDKYVTGNYWKRHGMSMPESEKRKVASEKLRLSNRYGMFEPDLLPWNTIRDVIHDLPAPTEGSDCSEHVLRNGAREYNGHSGSEIDLPSKTIKAGGHGVPGGENMIKFTDGSVRYFTVKEAKRIQTFPDDYPITGSWSEAMRQLGNAVPVHLAYVIGQAVMEKLSHTAS